MTIDDEENPKRGISIMKRKGKGKKRVITPARREQNRLAQQIWRRNKQSQLRLKEVSASTLTSVLDTTDQPSSVKSDQITSTPTATSTSSSSSCSSWTSTSFVDTNQHWTGHILNGTSPYNLQSPSPSPSSSSSASAPTCANTVAPISNNTRQDTSHPCLNALLVPPQTQAQTQMVTYAPSPPKVLTPMNDLVFLALLDNALCLGIDLSDILACSQSIISPFYRPDIMLQDDPLTLTLSSTRSRVLPPSLIPTLSQIIIPHHPGLDLLPLPALRDRSLLLSEATSTKSKFSPWALMRDILLEGGLILADKDGNYDGMSSGSQPWEEKRWVAEPWFASKWRLAVG